MAELVQLGGVGLCTGESFFFSVFLEGTKEVRFTVNDVQSPSLYLMHRTTSGLSCQAETKD